MNSALLFKELSKFTQNQREALSDIVKVFVDKELSVQEGIDILKSILKMQGE